ncbi:MAG: restriction endonuclease [Xanthobacteraceae bacterium]|nr:restriction endonuclease [Xanthobacteraceae bacterium]
MVRSNGGDYAQEFKDKGIVAIGWKAAGPLNEYRTREQIIARVKATWPEYKRMKAVVTGSQLDKMANVIDVGDRVITYDPSQRIYFIGKVTGNYQFDSEAEQSIANRRKVDWQHELDRDRLSVSAKNSLGSTLTVFEVPQEVEREIDALISGQQVPDAEWVSVPDASISTDNILDDLKSRAKEFIKDRLVELDWEQMQELVAGVLRAMGYKTRVSPQGADRGKDIVASPDGLGFEQPRIVVEVKHRPNQQIGAQDIRSFLGGRHKDDRGLYVSTGGFSKDAKYEADRAAIPLALIDVDELVEQVIEYYEKLDLETRSLLPLTRIYWPSE